MADSSEDLQDQLQNLRQKSRLLRKQAEEVEAEASALHERIASNRAGDRPQSHSETLDTEQRRRSL